MYVKLRLPSRNDREKYNPATTTPMYVCHAQVTPPGLLERRSTILLLLLPCMYDTVEDGVTQVDNRPLWSSSNQKVSLIYNKIALTAASDISEIYIFLS